MNKKFKKIIAICAVGMTLVSSSGVSAFASEVEANESEQIINELLTNPDSVDYELVGNKVYVDGEEVENVTCISEIIDVDVKDDEELIELGLLEENYKEEILNSKARGSETFIVWYEHPYTFTTKRTFLLNFYKVMGYTTTTSKVTAGYINSTKKLKVEITKKGTPSDTSPFVNTHGTTITNTGYVTLGKTSSSSFKTYHKDSTGRYTNITPTTNKTSAKFNSLVQGNTQVGFGIKTTVTV